jgi:predicted DNA-binding transcriptional regulator AlpA
MTVKTYRNKPKPTGKPKLPALSPKVEVPPAVRLLSKAKVIAITGVTYKSIWKWMQQGRFPRSRFVGRESKWLSTEIDQWLADLPIMRLKGEPDGVGYVDVRAVRWRAGRKRQPAVQPATEAA